MSAWILCFRCDTWQYRQRTRHEFFCSRANLLQWCILFKFLPLGPFALRSILKESVLSNILNIFTTLSTTHFLMSGLIFFLFQKTYLISVTCEVSIWRLLL